MRRIALVTPIFPVAHDQTRGRYIYEIARPLSKMAHVKVFFQQPRYPKWLAMAARSQIYGEVGADYRIEGVDVDAFNYPAIPSVTRAWNAHIAAHVLKPRVEAFKPDVMLAYWVYPDGLSAVRVGNALGAPTVIGALGSDVHVRSGTNASRTREAIAGADALITVSEAMRRATIAEFGARPGDTHTVVNGFNTAVFYARPQADMRRELGVPPDAQLIIYVGRFVEAKGMRELLSAFAQLRHKRPLARLALVGDGVMRKELEDLIQAQGLGDAVFLPGGQSPENVARWIGASDLLTLPSWSEGYPNVVVEALACGRPAVATDVGGTNEIVNANNGILIPARDAPALEAALSRALDAQWDHAAIAASMRRTWGDVATETLEICEQVLKRRI
jgi:glycosyltransferase involved in cell wall biosynthesis